ncbi:MAG: DUF177 domain-containing protein [Proteobacteria bacterium]|nr:DUF177 domain-containing protein [Pseudomonadota bacterium]
MKTAGEHLISIDKFAAIHVKSPGFMQGKLKRHYQIQKEVSRGDYFQGVIELRALLRLAGKLESDQGKIMVEFEFTASDYDCPILNGRLETSLTVECQRCLKSMDVAMKSEFKLLIDAPDELAHESSLDTIYSDNGAIDIFEVVEEELILGLPLVAMHDDISCDEYGRSQDETPDISVKENPFSVLKKLKTTD